MPQLTEFFRKFLEIENQNQNGRLPVGVRVWVQETFLRIFA